MFFILPFLYFSRYLPRVSLILTHFLLTPSSLSLFLQEKMDKDKKNKKIRVKENQVRKKDSYGNKRYESKRCRKLVNFEFFKMVSENSHVMSKWSFNVKKVRDGKIRNEL